MASTAGSSRIIRFIGPIVGLGVAAFVLYQQFGPATLPACDRDEVRETLGDLVSQTGTPAQPAEVESLGQFEELAFDEAADIRSCAAVATLEDASAERLNYTIAWNSKDDEEFLVELRRLPQCDSDKIQISLRQLVEDFERQRQPGRELAGFEAISQSSADAEQETRSCATVARFAGGAEQGLTYVVRWNDAERQEYSVEGEWQP